jgi:hypothetical protein
MPGWAVYEIYREKRNLPYLLGDRWSEGWPPPRITSGISVFGFLESSQKRLGICVQTQPLTEHLKKLIIYVMSLDCNIVILCLVTLDLPPTMWTSRGDEENQWLEFEDNGEQGTEDNCAWEGGVQCGHKSLWDFRAKNGKGLASSKQVVSLW